MSTYNSKVIDAPLSKVWDTIRDFSGMDWAAGVVESCEPMNDKRGDQLGMTRKLNGAFVETLIALDDQDHVIKYAMDDGPGPVHNCEGYVGTLKAHSISDGDKTFVEWTAAWDSNDSAVFEIVDPVYKALLSAMAANIK